MKIMSVLFAPDWAILPLLVLIFVIALFGWAIKKMKTKNDEDKPVD